VDARRVIARLMGARRADFAFLYRNVFISTHSRRDVHLDFVIQFRKVRAKTPSLPLSLDTMSHGSGGSQRGQWYRRD